MQYTSADNLVYIYILQGYAAMQEHLSGQVQKVFFF